MLSKPWGRVGFQGAMHPAAEAAGAARVDVGIDPYTPRRPCLVGADAHIGPQPTVCTAPRRTHPAAFPP